MLKRLFADRGQLDLEVQFVSANDQVLFQRRELAAARDLNQNGERQRLGYDCLPDIEDAAVMAREKGRQLNCQPGPVASREHNEGDFVLGGIRNSPTSSPPQEITHS